jgi:uncharacterized protein YjiS (DUF1127 family)
MANTFLLDDARPSVLARMMQGAGDWLDLLAQGHRVSRRVSELTGLSDAQLAARGLTRDDIPRLIAQEFSAY